MIFRETSYAMVMEFRPLSRYWEQTLTIFDDILLEKTVQAQLGLHHTRKSRKAWKNSVQWKKCQSMLFASAVSSFLNFSRNLVQVCYNVKRTCIFHLILICIPSIFILSIKNRGVGGARWLLNSCWWWLYHCWTVVEHCGSHCAWLNSGGWSLLIRF